MLKVNNKDNQNDAILVSLLLTFISTHLRPMFPFYSLRKQILFDAFREFKKKTQTEMG